MEISKRHEAALSWWNSLTGEERENGTRRFRVFNRVAYDYQLENDDVLNIWESEGWPDPVIELGFDENKRSPREQILATIQDLVSNFVYYDRKEDEDLSVQQFNDAIANGDITVDEIVAEFRKHLENTFNK